MNDTTDRELPAELDHWYRVAALRYHQALESLTALELNATRRHLELFSNLLLGTLTASESGFEEIGPHASGDEEAEMVRTDFMILRRSLPRLTAALGQLESVERDGGSLRSAMVDQLDTFVRTANVLARHHDRMEATVLPLLEQHLDASRSREIARDLSTRMHQAQPN